MITCQANERKELDWNVNESNPEGNGITETVRVMEPEVAVVLCVESGARHACVNPLLDVPRNRGRSQLHSDSLHLRESVTRYC